MARRRTACTIVRLNRNVQLLLLLPLLLLHQLLLLLRHLLLLLFSCSCVATCTSPG
jgi:hypothetical protein